MRHALKQKPCVNIATPSSAQISEGSHRSPDGLPHCASMIHDETNRENLIDLVRREFVPDGAEFTIVDRCCLYSDTGWLSIFGPNYRLGDCRYG
jgi:hypothetical protein